MPSDQGSSPVMDAVAEALDLPSESRAAFLVARLPNERQRSEAERLLRACERAKRGSLLDTPAIHLAAPLVEGADWRESETEALGVALSGRYSIERELGRGGQATVYLARDERHGRPVALKVLHGVVPADSGPTRRASWFRREIELAAPLAHPHILPVFDSGAAAGRLFLVTPYVDGENLRDRLAIGGRMPLETAIHLLRDVCRALSYAHRHGVVHRDIKPANILLTRDGDALVSDFGVARGLAAAIEPSSALDPGPPAGAEDLTDSGLVVGTPAYLSPEQASGSRDVDHRSDLYSLGVVAYELLTGATPFAGASREELLAAHRLQVPVPVSQRSLEVPAALAALVDQLIAKRPDDRPSDAAAVLKVLDTEMKAAPRIRRGRMAASILAAAVMLAAVPVMLASRKTQPRGTILAVGRIEASGGGGGMLADGAEAVKVQLGSELAQLQGLAVLSDGRLHEMVARARGSMDQRADIMAAARRAGATELVDGEISRSENGFRLDLQRTRLADGTVVGTMELEGRRVSDLAIQASSRLATAHRVPPAVRSLGALTSQSPVARSSYERGMRALFAGDLSEARRHFSVALEADPGFFAAAYYAAGISDPGEAAGLNSKIARAAAAADSAPERERLQIRTMWALREQDPRAVAYAESLATHYPAEPEGRYHLGVALAIAGNFGSAIEQLRSAIASDSVLLDSAVTGEAPCRACRAMFDVAQSYLYLDSIDATRDWLNRWRQVMPSDAAGPTMAQALLLSNVGRHREALALLRDSLHQPVPSDAYYLLFEAPLRAGDFAQVEHQIAEDLASNRYGYANEATWWDVLYQQTRGRFRAAIASADRYCTLVANYCLLIRGRILEELGRADEAAAILRKELATSVPDSSLLPGIAARQRTWLMLHVAEARAAAGDTAGLMGLADSMEAVGRLSGYGRDRRLHHHVRGVLYRSRGYLAQADAEFQAAEFAPAYSYSQSRYYRAQMLLEQGKAGEAVEVLEPLLRRSLSAMGSYLSQTDVHALLAEALAAAGRRAEAMTHLQWVERAWDGADPEVIPRLEALRMAVRR